MFELFLNYKFLQVFCGKLLFPFSPVASEILDPKSFINLKQFLNNTVYFGTLICPFSTKSLLRLHGFLLTWLFFQSLKKQKFRRGLTWIATMDFACSKNIALIGWLRYFFKSCGVTSRFWTPLGLSWWGGCGAVEVEPGLALAAEVAEVMVSLAVNSLLQLNGHFWLQQFWIF